MLSESKVKTDENLNFVINNFVIYGAIFTIYGMIIIHIKSRAIHLLLFMILVVVEVLVLYFLSDEFRFVGYTG